jgi:hypothetical protein
VQTNISIAVFKKPETRASEVKPELAFTSGLYLLPFGAAQLDTGEHQKNGLF